MATHNVVAIVGSLRKESFSLKIAHALAKLAPASLKLEVTTLHDISFFNQDLEGAPPADWLAFREKLQKSNGVLFVTPEYNRSIPGVLKNALDQGHGGFPAGSRKKLEAARSYLDVAPPVVRTATDIPLGDDIDGTLPAVPPDEELLTEMGAGLGLGSSLTRFRAVVTKS